MEVEDAILELLQPLREMPGAKTLAAFQGQPDKDTWARLRRGFPAVLVLYPGTYALLAAARERSLGVPPLPGMGPCLPSSIQGFVLDGASVYRMTVSTIHNIAL